LNVNVVGTSECGNFRNKNQDCLYFARRNCQNSDLAIACVCDGIGSFKNSEISSQMMVKGIADWFESIGRFFPEVMSKQAMLDDLEYTLQELNEVIYEYEEKIGCTMSLLFLVDGEYYVFHVGDSRIYMVRDRLYQLTQDEVLLKQVNGVEKSFLVNSIGQKMRVSITKRRGYVNMGDTFVLGTDGLCKRMKYEDVYDLQARIWGEGELMQKSRTLVEQVYSRGEKDNVTCVIVQVTG